MNFWEEHSYVTTKQVKPDPEKAEPHFTELNIKMEYDEPLNEMCDTESVNPLEEAEVGHSESENKENRLRMALQRNTDLKSRNTYESSEDEGSMESALNLSGLEKACLLQTCLNLLDSSSSDEDELMLLWLLCSKRKKKLRKRRKV